jgi:hypothetical protein
MGILMITACRSKHANFDFQCNVTVLSDRRRGESNYDSCRRAKLCEKEAGHCNTHRIGLLRFTRGNM